MKVILTVWTMNYVDCVLFIVLIEAIEVTNLKSVILEFPKNMIKPSVFWLIYLTLLVNFQIMQGLMKSNGCAPLLLSKSS